MIVRITVVVMLVVGSSAVGVGPCASIGMSPAKAEPERMHVKASAITKRFIGVSPSNLRDARTQTTNRIEQYAWVLARRSEGN